LGYLSLVFCKPGGAGPGQAAPDGVPQQPETAEDRWPFLNAHSQNLTSFFLFFFLSMSANLVKLVQAKQHLLLCYSSPRQLRTDLHGGTFSQTVWLIGL